MKINKTTTDDFVKYVNDEDLKIVVYGYGVIGKVLAPFFLERNEIGGRVLCFVDADPNKQGLEVRFGQYSTRIVSPEILERIDEKYTVLVTGSRFGGIVSFLSGVKPKNEFDVFILPWMVAKEHGTGDFVKTDNSLIPRVINYCWFGGNPIPDELKRYMESWHRMCPDYIIKEWNEDNYDVEKDDYTRLAYNNRKWAFVSDVAKVEILYESGGIYLDTDVELVRPLDDLLCCKGFVATEKWGVINIGGGCGVIPHHPMMERLLDYRKGFSFVNPDGSLNLESSGMYETMPFVELGYIPDGNTQVIEDMTILSSDYFHPYDYMTKETLTTDKTFGIHRYYGSWC